MKVHRWERTARWKNFRLLILRKRPPQFLNCGGLFPMNPVMSAQMAIFTAVLCCRAFCKGEDPTAKTRRENHSIIVGAAGED